MEIEISTTSGPFDLYLIGEVTMHDASFDHEFGTEPRMEYVVTNVQVLLDDNNVYGSLNRTTKDIVRQKLIEKYEERMYG